MSQISANQTTGVFPCQIISTIGEKLYLSEKMADFHFTFETMDGDFERVPAHKNFLITASDVFEVMFNGTWEEVDEVEIVDAPVAAFKEFLQFFYFGQVKVTTENVTKVMYLADKYNLAEGLNVCAKFIANTLTDDNVCSSYRLAILYGHRNLKKLCETVISTKARAVFNSNSFLECDVDVLEHILTMDSLNCSEMELFEACISWVKSSSNQNQLTKEIVQAKLGNLMAKIRFGSMSAQEFASLIPLHGDLFSANEYKEIFQMVTSKEYRSEIFSNDHRKRAETAIPNNNSEIECSRMISKYCSEEEYNIKDIETSVFSCNQPLLFTSFWCDVIYKKDGGYYTNLEGTLKTSVKVIEISDPKDSDAEAVLYSKDTFIHCTEGTRITLSRPILIKTGFMYKIRMQQSPPDGYCTGCLLKSEVQVQPDITVRFHNDAVVDGDDAPRGLILGLHFKRL